MFCRPLVARPVVLSPASRPTTSCSLSAFDFPTALSLLGVHLQALSLRERRGNLAFTRFLGQCALAAALALLRSTVMCTKEE
ncbi:galactose mutarotase [Sesbania bispinosa]|nr:galactose mutarotase [Sesbania bispinosa]